MASDFSDPLNSENEISARESPPHLPTKPKSSPAQTNLDLVDTKHHESDPARQRRGIIEPLIPRYIGSADPENLPKITDSSYNSIKSLNEVRHALAEHHKEIGKELQEKTRPVIDHLIDLQTKNPELAKKLVDSRKTPEGQLGKLYVSVNDGDGHAFGKKNLLVDTKRADWKNELNDHLKSRVADVKLQAPELSRSPATPDNLGRLPLAPDATRNPNVTETIPNRGLKGHNGYSQYTNEMLGDKGPNANRTNTPHDDQNIVNRHYTDKKGVIARTLELSRSDYPNITPTRTSGGVSITGPSPEVNKFHDFHLDGPGRLPGVREISGPVHSPSKQTPEEIKASLIRAEGTAPTGHNNVPENPKLQNNPGGTIHKPGMPDWMLENDSTHAKPQIEPDIHPNDVKLPSKWAEALRKSNQTPAAVETIHSPIKQTGSALTSAANQTENESRSTQKNPSVVNSSPSKISATDNNSTPKTSVKESLAESHLPKIQEAGINRQLSSASQPSPNPILPAKASQASSSISNKGPSLTTPSSSPASIVPETKSIESTSKIIPTSHPSDIKPTSSPEITSTAPASENFPSAIARSAGVAGGLLQAKKGLETGDKGRTILGAASAVAPLAGKVLPVVEQHSGVIGAGIAAGSIALDTKDAFSKTSGAISDKLDAAGKKAEESAKNLTGNMFGVGNTGTLERSIKDNGKQLGSSAQETIAGKKTVNEFWKDTKHAAGSDYHAGIDWAKSTLPGQGALLAKEASQTSGAINQNVKDLKKLETPQTLKGATQQDEAGRPLPNSYKQLSAASGDLLSANHLKQDPSKDPALSSVGYKQHEDPAVLKEHLDRQFKEASKKWDARPWHEKLTGGALDSHGETGNLRQVEAAQKQLSSYTKEVDNFKHSHPVNSSNLKDSLFKKTTPALIDLKPEKPDPPHPTPSQPSIVSSTTPGPIHKTNDGDTIHLAAKPTSITLPNSLPPTNNQSPTLPPAKDSRKDAGLNELIHTHTAPQPNHSQPLGHQANTNNEKGQSPSIGGSGNSLLSIAENTSMNKPKNTPTASGITSNLSQRFSHPNATSTKEGKSVSPIAASKSNQQPNIPSGTIAHEKSMLASEESKKNIEKIKADLAGKINPLEKGPSDVSENHILNAKITFKDHGVKDGGTTDHSKITSNAPNKLDPQKDKKSQGVV